MDDQTTLEDDREDTPASQLPEDTEKWSKENVRQWILQFSIVDEKYADILFKEEVNGEGLLSWNVSDYKDAGIPLGPAKLIIKKIGELKKSQDEKLGGHCTAYPFNRYNEGHRYRENSDLVITETGSSDLVEPCHEFKAFNNAITPEEQKEKFISEVICFGAACMNSRTNGTIHFGIGDVKSTFRHGQILGFVPHNKEAFLTYLSVAIEGNFEYKHKEAAKKCIKTPRFVEVLSPNMTFSNKYVLEVDIKPDYLICKENIYKVRSVHKSGKKKKNKASEDGKEDLWPLYIRENNSIINLHKETHKKVLRKYLDNISQLSTDRKKAEESRIHTLKKNVQGYKLCEMITGGTTSLDRSHYQEYILVANKPHPVQLESLSFLCEMKLFAVLDFDPDHELKVIFENENMTDCSPKDYKINDSVLITKKNLKLKRTTNWVFCNGSTCFSEIEKPSETSNWLIEKGAAVRDVVSFLCRKDVLPPKKFLVVFMLLSDVTDNKDPLLRTCSMFLEELKGSQQILCICENKKQFNNWTQLMEHSCGIDISDRCICDLSFAEICGTVLSLWLNNLHSQRFLPGGGGGKVELTRKMQGRLDMLDILCVNQCEGEKANKTDIEEHFYRGGKVTWWNFQFCEEPGSIPFIKRDKFDYILNTIIPDITSSNDTCALVNIVHLPGCGATTLAMHILWELKKKFRCAIVLDEFPSEIAKQVMELLFHGTNESPTLSVLLMIDNFGDEDDIHHLKRSIEAEYQKKDLVSSNVPKVIILSCTRTDSLESTESTSDTVFIGHKLSEKEQKLFEQKLQQIKQSYKHKADTFYSFMIMKEGFSSDYVKDVAKNILKKFDINHKGAEVFAVLTLLHFYCKGASLSVALCEELLGLQTEPNSNSCKVEDGLGKFSPLVTRCWEENGVRFEAVKVIHRKFAEHCLKEMKVTKADIITCLLKDEYFQCTQGTHKLIKNIRAMLVKRDPVTNRFSPLIQDIIKETQGLEENILLNAAKHFKEDAFICQQIARYYSTFRSDNFRDAKRWAKKAKELLPSNSYISDTSAQVIKRHLWKKVQDLKHRPIEPETLKECLWMAKSATEAFQETVEKARNESMHRWMTKYATASFETEEKAKGDFDITDQDEDSNTFNTAGCLGQIQVAVKVLEILEKIPFFSEDRKKLCDFLLNRKALQHIISSDTVREYENYYNVLQSFDGFLLDVKHNMKRQFDFFYCFFVTLTKNYQQNESERKFRHDVSVYFDRYANLFNQSYDEEREDELNIRQNIEMNNADTVFGLLHYLSHLKEANKIENIFRDYKLITVERKSKNIKDIALFIYVNIILHCAKPTSGLKLPYFNLLKMLRRILQGPISQNDSFAVNFLAVMLLWPEGNSEPNKNIDNFSDRDYLAQLKAIYEAEMKPLNFGMQPIAHFFLGNKPGYERLVCQEEINMPTDFDRKTGCITENNEVKQLLLQVSGVVERNCILADTVNPNVKVQVSPFTSHQLIGKKKGARVTFYVGFSMNGPIAFNIK